MFWGGISAIFVIDQSPPTSVPVLECYSAIRPHFVYSEFWVFPETLPGLSWNSATKPRPKKAISNSDKEASFNTIYGFKGFSNYLLGFGRQALTSLHQKVKLEVLKKMKKSRHENQYSTTQNIEKDEKSNIIKGHKTHE